MSNESYEWWNMKQFVIKQLGGIDALTFSWLRILKWRNYRGNVIIGIGRAWMWPGIEKGEREEMDTRRKICLCMWHGLLVFKVVLGDFVVKFNALNAVTMCCDVLCCAQSKEDFKRRRRRRRKWWKKLQRQATCFECLIVFYLWNDVSYLQK